MEGRLVLDADWSRMAEHQKEGALWMEQRIKRREGFILGDEMGLGKTFQILSIIHGLWARNARRVMVVAPLTLIANWEKEIEKFRMQIGTSVISSKTTKKEMGAILGSFSRNQTVIITTYEIVVKHIGNFARVYMDAVVLDEGQRIKNRETKVSGSCKQLRADVKAVVTGTPMQNNLSELWNLVDFVRPGHLGDPHRFKAEVEDPIKRSKLKRAGALDKDRGERLQEELKEQMQGIILRRKKSETAVEIGPKKEVIVYCPLSKQQRRMYREALEGEAVRRTVEGKDNPLKTIYRLRQLCNHPCLLEEGGCPPLSDTEQLIKASGKMRVLVALAEGWKRENKNALVFSQSKRLLRIAEASLAARLNVRVHRIDSGVPVEKRAAVIRAFGASGEPEILLLSTRVGGVGLSLVRASRVVIFDMDWNPFNDEQAKDRAHRIGQRDAVEVYKLICPGTIEDAIYSNQELKKSLSEGVLSKRSPRALFDKVDLCRLFHFSYDKAKTNREVVTNAGAGG